MRSARSVGRIIGVLLLAQLAGLIVPFVLLHPLTVDTSALLAGAAEAALQIKVAVLLLLANCVLTIVISFAAFPVLRQHGATMALLLVAASVIMFSLQAVDNAHLLSMLSLSQQYTQAGGEEQLFLGLVEAVRSTRRWVHYTELLAIDGWIFALFSALYRFALVPRALAAFGLITAMLHFTGITVPLFLGHPGVTLMGASMGLGQLALGLWLIIKGLGEGRHPAGAQVTSGGG
jgi:hypothetical protein